ncbi:DNA ligase [Vibrio phage vB_VmeM-32]|nr:DNA ligase [Vibrio phage vB_VmeM-32]
MTVFQIIQKLKSIESTNEKLNFLKLHKDNNDFMNVLKYAYDKMNYNFYIASKSFPDLAKMNQSGTKSLSDSLTEIVDNICTRKVTGNAAIEFLSDILKSTSFDNQKVIELIFKRDLDCGIGPATINKGFPNLIPEIPQMLASSENDELIDVILTRGDAVAELKADGSRNHALVDDSITMITRNGSRYTGLTKIEELLEKYVPKGFVVDGEIVYRSSDGANREEGNGIVNKSIQGTISSEESDQLIFQVWDMIPIDVYRGTVKSTEPLSVRRTRLEQLVDTIGDNRIVLIEQTPVQTIDDVKRVYRKYVDAGFEGIILKDNNSVWENKRSKNIVKFKEKIRIDLEVIDVYSHKKDPNKVGGFTVRSSCGRIVSDVGSGFTDTTRYRDKLTKQWVNIPLNERDSLDREYLWSIRNELNGSIFEIEINNVTQKKNRKASEPEFSLSFPVVKLRRIDKSVANSLIDVFPQYDIDAKDDVSDITQQSSVKSTKFQYMDF